MSKEKTQKTNSFSEDYEELKKIAAQVENMETENLDTILEILPKATELHKKCKDRIEKIKKILENKLED